MHKPERNCEICNKPVVAGYAPYRAHMQKHVNEGIVIKKSSTKGEPGFPKVPFAWWGYVLTSDRELVTVRSFTAPHSSMTINRYKVGGVTQPGDAVRLEFRKAQATKTIDTNLGGWYAEPLGYKAAWVRIPAIYG